jgi:hypothetical protein
MAAAAPYEEKAAVRPGGDGGLAWPRGLEATAAAVASGWMSFFFPFFLTGGVDLICDLDLILGCLQFVICLLFLKKKKCQNYARILSIFVQILSNLWQKYVKFFIFHQDFHICKVSKNCRIQVGQIHN